MSFEQQHEIGLTWEAFWFKQGLISSQDSLLPWLGQKIFEIFFEII